MRPHTLAADVAFGEQKRTPPNRKGLTLLVKQSKPSTWIGCRSSLRDHPAAVTDHMKGDFMLRRICTLLNQAVNQLATKKGQHAALTENGRCSPTRHLA